MIIVNMAAKLMRRQRQCLDFRLDVLVNYSRP